jgi:hypothetical protein
MLQYIDLITEIDSLLPPPLPPAKTAPHLAKIIHEIIATVGLYLLSVCVKYMLSYKNIKMINDIVISL